MCRARPPDLYPTFEDYRRCFVELVGGLPAEGLLVLCADDPEAVALQAHTSSPTATYGEAQGAGWQVVPGKRTSPVTVDGVHGELQHFDVRSPDGENLPVALTFPGAHSRLNATAALALADHLGAPLSTCVSACSSFRGPARRFQVLADIDGISVVDDYGHHPTEVAVTVATALERYPGRRLITVCIPHTYSRTRLFLDHYRRCFIGSDMVVLGPIEAARERHLPATISSEDVAAEVRASPEETDEVHVVDSAEAAIDTVAPRARAGDVILCISLGGFEGFAERLVAALPSRGHG
ncbi:MAG: glutamate ligase domain-containing protein [Candidatus Dormibacteria bacterium]